MTDESMGSKVGVGGALAALEPAVRERVRRALRPMSAEARRMSGTERLNALLSVPHSEQFVPSLPTEDLYFFLLDVGLEDGCEIIRYASQEQLTGFVDLGCWDRDEVSIERFARWFAIAEHNGPQHATRFLRSLDPEFITLFLLRTARVWDTREAPEDLPDTDLLLPSPDGAFSLQMAADDDRFLLVREVLRTLYADDLEWARALLQASRWELPSSLQERCYQWRVARLSDMGFPPFDDAVTMEQDADLDAFSEAARRGVSLAPEEAAGAAEADERPFAGWFLARMDEGPYLSRLLVSMADDSARERVLTSLVYLVNRRLAIRGLDMGEWSLLESEAGHAFRMSSIGLEWLSHQHAGEPAELLRSWPLLAFYRIGRTLVARLGKRARTVARRAALRAGHSPFDPPLDMWLEALQAAPPLRHVPPTLASPAPDETAAEPFAPFGSLAEVDAAEAVVAESESVLAFFIAHYGYGPELLDTPELAPLTPAQRDGLRFSSLLLTGIANRVLDRSRDFAPLTAEDARDFAAMVLVEHEGGERRLDPRLRRVAQEQLFPMTGRVGRSARRALGRFVDRSLTALEETFLLLPAAKTPDPRFLDDVVLIAQGPAQE